MLNELRLDAQIAEKSPVRYTPAGIPVTDLKLAHQSSQTEAGNLRQVNCEIVAVAMGEQALLLATSPLGSALRVSGFLAAKSLKNRSLVLHVTQTEFLEG